MERGKFHGLPSLDKDLKENYLLGMIFLIGCPMHSSREGLEGEKGEKNVIFYFNLKSEKSEKIKVKE